MHQPPVAIGDTVAEKYVVERVIGEGGMGIVLAARHRELEQRVAIKCLLPEIAQRNVAAERFRREARAVANMRSEHICRVLDVGTLHDGVPFMIMEYLEGCDLAQELERRGRIPYPEAVDYVLQACDALAEAHRAGIIHRDLKPANLFLEQRGNGVRRVKVLDFGVSKSMIDAQLSQQALTRTANLVGSPLYMSPEQLESSRDVDARADIWGLGVVLYELISGQPPFNAGTIPQLVASVIHDQPRPFRNDLVPQVPPELAAVVALTLSKDRSLRPSSIEEVADALEPFRAAQSSAAGLRRTTELGATEAPSARPSTAAKSTPTPLSWDRRSVAPARRLRRAVAMGLAALALAGAVALIRYRVFGGGSTPEPSPSPAIAKPLLPADRAGRPDEAPEVGDRSAEPSSPGETNANASAASTADTHELPHGTDAPALPRGSLPEPPAASAASAQPRSSPTSLPLPTPAPQAAAKAVEDATSKSGANTRPPAQTAPKPSEAPAPTRPVSPVAIEKTPSPGQHPDTLASPAPTPRGAPPRGQISDFGGRR